MWTDQDTKTVKRLLKNFRPKNRFVVPEFKALLRSEGHKAVAKKLEKSPPKFSGWELLRQACKGHVCACCHSVVIGAVSNVCPSCRKTKKGRILSKELSVQTYKASCLEKYGVTNPMLTKQGKTKVSKALAKVFSSPRKAEILHKRKATSLDRYGVETPLHNAKVNEKFRKAIAKTRAEHGDEWQRKIDATFKRKYGGHPMTDEKIKAKQRKVLFEKYGHENAAHGEQAEIKRRKTMVARYGENPHKAITKKGRKTLKKRYGVYHPLQVKEFRHKAQASAQTLKAVKIKGRTFQCQGYEPQVLKHLVRKFGLSDVVGQFDNDFKAIMLGSRTYSPDFYIKSRSTYVEVKSTFTLLGGYGGKSFLPKLRKDFSKLAEAGVKCRLVVYHEKTASCVTLPKDWYMLTKREIAQLSNLG